MVCSVDSAAKASAGSNWRYDDNGMGRITRRQPRSAGWVPTEPSDGEDDLLDLHLGLGQLLLAVPLEQGAALIGGDRLVELHLAALELLDDAFELFQGIFERQADDVLMDDRFFGHRRLLKGVPHCSRGGVHEPARVRGSVCGGK